MTIENIYLPKKRPFKFKGSSKKLIRLIIAGQPKAVIHNLDRSISKLMKILVRTFNKSINTASNGKTSD